MPFFSPDWSADTLVALIDSAKRSVDVGTPGFSSFSGCSSGKTCIGCNATKQRNDVFFVFSALLNAVHRGVAVRVLTNDYNNVDCAGMISPLPFLKLNGVAVRYYRTTTFLHTKYTSVDGERVSISSVNFSKASFLKNREAGAVLSGAGAAPLVAFFTSVFDADWQRGYDLVLKQTYSAQAMAIITDKTPVTVSLPPVPSNATGHYVTPKPQPIAARGTNITVEASPDYAYKTLLAAVDSAQLNFTLMIYQVTDTSLCDKLVAMHRAGLELRLLVSSRIYGAGDCVKAKQCYKKLWDAGYRALRKTPMYYSFSHQKFFIKDHTMVSWSTGNWSPTDYPEGTDPQSFPPYAAGSGSGWRKANRDFSVYVTDKHVIDVFDTVYEEDNKRGRDWTPEYDIYCGF
jgi:phosphatidylserine/phosphatidylglycerophosphate/cardiolipin synthase-like enzyme